MTGPQRPLGKAVVQELCCADDRIQMEKVELTPDR